MNSISYPFVYLHKEIEKGWTLLKKRAVSLVPCFSLLKTPSDLLYRFKERKFIHFSLQMMGFMVYEYLQCVLEKKEEDIEKDWAFLAFYVLSFAQIFLGRPSSESPSTTPLSLEEWDYARKYLTGRSLIHRSINTIYLAFFLADLAMRLEDSALRAGISCLLCSLEVEALCFLGHLFDKSVYPRTLLFLSENSRKNQEIALVLTATLDHNGALKNVFDLEYLDQLAQRFFLQEKKVSSFQELQQAVEETARSGSIKVLVIHAHGNPDFFMLSDEHIVTGKEAAFSSTLKQLHSEGIIILKSCSTGKKEREVSCVAENIALQAGKRKVFSPADDCSHMALTEEEGYLHPKFYAAQSPLVIQKRFPFISFRSLMKDISAPPFTSTSPVIEQEE